MRLTNSQAEIMMLNGNIIHRVVFSARMFKHCYMGFIRMENKIVRVYLHGTQWHEHFTDWRYYDTVTEARRYDRLYDIEYPNNPVEYVQGIGLM